MKIGLLTLPLHTNYGGILQAYALKTYLERNGHEVWLININKRTFFLCEFIKYLVRNILFRNDVFVLGQKIQKFIDKYMQPSTVYIDLNRKLIKLQNYQFDAYIVGSDQVWRESYCREIKKHYFLDFVDNVNVKKIIYAASFGGNQWEYGKQLTQEFALYAQKLDAISVREDSAVRLCEDYLGVQAKHLIDPTMLLNSSDYEKLITSKQYENNSIGVYILDNSDKKSAIIDFIADFFSYKKQIIGVEYEWNLLKFKILKKTSIGDWLQIFKNSKFIVTDSFHGCIFSILFKKPFIVIGNEIRGMARFESLLRMFSLEYRLIHSIDDLSSEKLEEPINWDYVYDLLEKYRTEVVSFLNILNK